MRRQLIEALGELPVLPDEAAAQRERLAGEEAKLRNLPAPSLLLDGAEEIERLEEELPVHRRSLRELPVVEARLSELAGARKRALADVGLPDEVLPAPRLERQSARAASRAERGNEPGSRALKT